MIPRAGAPGGVAVSIASMQPGKPMAATGLLLRDGGGFALDLDGGGRVGLEMHRVPVDEVAKRVRIVGTWLADGRVDVDGVSLARGG